jgi:hypothetical protein
MWHLNYNIHDLLKISVTGNERFDLGRKLKWVSFEDDEGTDDPDIVLNIGKFEPSNKNCDIIAHKYHIKKNYFYCKDKGKKIKWEVEIFGFEEGKTVINFDGKDSGLKGILFPSFLAQEFLIPLIEYMLVQKNYFLLHAGAVSKNSNAYIFTGRPGAYKTTLIMDFIRRANFNFLGDDRIIVNKGKVLSFPRMLFFFEFMLKNMPTEECSFFDKARSFKYFISKKKYETNVPLINSSELKALFFVSRADRKNVNKTKLSLKKGVYKLIVNNKAEYVTSTPTIPSGQFYKYMLVYSLVFPNNRLAKHWDVMMEGLEEVLKGMPMYVIEMPYGYDLRVFDEVMKFVEGVVMHK